MLDKLSQGQQDAGDAGSLGAVAASFFKILPEIAALLGVVWLAIRIWESDTMCKLTGRKPPERKDTSI